MMLALPRLKQMLYRGHLNDPFVEQLIENNAAKKDIISFVPF
jgi:hypothetical protein